MNGHENIIECKRNDDKICDHESCERCVRRIIKSHCTILIINIRRVYRNQDANSKHYFQLTMIACLLLLLPTEVLIASKI